jgi:hypothetical protein
MPVGMYAVGTGDTSNPHSYHDIIHTYLHTQPVIPLGKSILLALTLHTYIVSDDIDDIV